MDEPAFREGLPLDPALHNEYLNITVQAFKVFIVLIRRIYIVENSTKF
jgi:hypothetical protein